MDRNNVLQCNTVIDGQSLSARRAWIEIGNSCTQAEPEKVALRKESVDRNTIAPGTSVFRGWVALRKESVDRNVDPDADELTDDVALRKESVDRNALTLNYTIGPPFGRSPQGERG